MSQVRVKQDGDRVLMESGGKLIAEMPWEAALALGKALTSVGKLAEEYAAYAQGSIITDQAILLRAGVPLGLMHSPLAMEEAKKAAQWDRELRRAMNGAGGIGDTTVVNAPKVLQFKPEKENV